MLAVTFQTPVNFPARCSGCGNPSEQRRILRIVNGFTLIVLRFQRWMTVRVPVCRNCSFRRTMRSYLAVLILLVAVAAGAAATTARAMGKLTPEVQLTVIALVLGCILLVINFGERWNDYRVLGLCGRSFHGDMVTLLFRDSGFGEQVAGLNTGALFERPTLPSPRPPQ